MKIKSNKSRQSNKSRKIVEKIMSLKEMQRFIDKTNYIIYDFTNNANTIYMPIIVKAIYCRNEYSFEAYAEISFIQKKVFHYNLSISFFTILVNDWCLMTLNKQQIQAALLHEVGHFVNKHNNSYMDEYNAQKWAINKAKEMKLSKKVVKILREDFVKWLDSSVKWRKNYNDHYKAAKYAKKVGLI